MKRLRLESPWFELAIFFGVIAWVFIFAIAIPRLVTAPKDRPRPIEPASKAACYYEPTEGAPPWFPQEPTCYTSDGFVADCPADPNKLPACLRATR